MWAWMPKNRDSLGLLHLPKHLDGLQLLKQLDGILHLLKHLDGPLQLLKQLDGLCHQLKHLDEILQLLKQLNGLLQLLKQLLLLRGPQDVCTSPWKSESNPLWSKFLKLYEYWKSLLRYQ